MILWALLKRKRDQEMFIGFIVPDSSPKLCSPPATTTGAGDNEFCWECRSKLDDS